MQNKLININPDLTMSSLEIVKAINSIRKSEGNNTELRHADFLAKVPEVLGKLTSENFRSSYKDAKNETRPCYNFPKRESMLMAMSYSYSVQAAVYDAYEALENKNKYQLPDFTNPVEAARAWADEVEQKQQALALIEENKPKVKAFDQLIGSGALFTMNQTAKLLGWGRNKLFAELRDRGVLLSDNLPAQHHVDCGRFVVKDTVVDRGIKSIVVSQTLVTTKGQVWLSEVLSKKSESELL